MQHKDVLAHKYVLLTRKNMQTGVRVRLTEWWSDASAHGSNTKATTPTKTHAAASAQQNDCTRFLRLPVSRQRQAVDAILAGSNYCSCGCGHQNTPRRTGSVSEQIGCLNESAHRHKMQARRERCQGGVCGQTQNTTPLLGTGRRVLLAGCMDS